jgi:hypothetical protein
MEAAPKLVRRDPQGELSDWCDDTPALVLAVPPEDVELWRIRRDVKNCVFSALPRNQAGKHRYERLLEIAEASAYPASLIVFATFAVCGELCCRPSGYCGVASHPAEDLAKSLVRLFALPREDLPALRFAVRAGIEAGYLVTVNSADIGQLSRYRSVEDSVAVESKRKKEAIHRRQGSIWPRR